MIHTLKISCSSLGKIMTNPRSVKAKEAGELSETTKGEILRIWIADKYDKHKEYSSKFTDKGNHCEERGITAFERYIKRQGKSWVHSFPSVLMKNEERFYDEHFMGTPDILEDDFVADIKCPYDLENYMTASADDYDEQLQGYMHLTGRKKGLLVYCLLDAPEWLIKKEIYIMQRNSNPDLFEDIAEAVRRNMTFDNVPENQKVKMFEINYNPEFIKLAQERVIKCRSHYNSLTLTPNN